MEFQRFYLIDDDRTIIDGSDDLEDLRNLAESIVEHEGRLADSLAIVEVVLQTKPAVKWEVTEVTQSTTQPPRCECMWDAQTCARVRLCPMCASESLRPLGNRSDSND